MQRGPHEYSLPSAKLVSTNETLHGASAGKASLEFHPSHACARLIFRGGSLRHCKICGPISQDSHVQGTHSYRESQRGAGRTKTVKRVNTAEGQERVTRQGLCFTGDADVTNVENIFAIWRRVRLSWVGDLLLLLLPKLQQPHVRFWQIYSRYRGATHGNTTRCVTFLAALQRRPVTRSKIDSFHLPDKNGTGGRKLFLGTMPIALLATRAPWKKGGRGSAS